MTKLVISVGGMSDADVSENIERLKTSLESVAEVEDVPDKKAQSGTAVLAVILSSVVLQELAKGLASLFSRDRSATVEVELATGEKVKLSGVSQKTAMEIYAELSRDLDQNES